MALIKKIEASPWLARVLPFLVFAGLTSCQGLFGESSRYWMYLLKTLAGAGLIWLVRPWIEEMKWRCSWEAIVAGVAVFAVWVGLDDLYPKMGKGGAPWNPPHQFGGGTGPAWFFIGVRVLGSTLVVPPLEEVFYRSFLYRCLVKPDFLSIPLGCFHWTAFLAAAAVFGLAHHEWLPGILCACAYQGLVLRKKRLGDAMTAHAVTNFLLGLWVVWRGDWKFW